MAYTFPPIPPGKPLYPDLFSSFLPSGVGKRCQCRVQTQSNRWRVAGNGYEQSAEIRAKSKMNGCSITVDFGEKGVYIFYAHY
jgi:hypothetical protein